MASPVWRLRRAAVIVLVLVSVIVAAALIGEAMDPPGQDTMYNRQTAAVMRRVMAANANGVDVGAYIGQLTRPMVEVAPRGHHIAVEPQPLYAGRLRTKFPNVRVLELALGDKEDTVSFVQALDSPARSGFRRQQYPTDHERTRMITVRVARLDDVLTPAETPVAFIKIDVEGAEYMVLRGAVETIRRDRPVIVFEYGRTGMQEFGTTPAMMWSLLHDQLGLEVGVMKTWLDGAAPLTAAQFAAAVTDGTDWMFVAYPAAKAQPARGR